jgi:TolB-like protein
MTAVRRPAVKLAAAVVLTLLAGVLAWQAPRSLQTTSRKPVIAVLPLTTLGGDEATRRLADGLTEDILTDLSHFRGLEVVASSSSGTFNVKTVDPREIGKALGAPYLLTGTVQREAGQLRISAQLIAPSTGEHLWAQRWDRPAADAFAIQSELAEQVAATLGSIDSSAAITASEIGKAKGQAPASLQAYDYYLLAVEAGGKFTKEAVESGIEDAGRAIALDPGFARAYAIRARMEFNTTHHSRRPCASWRRTRGSQSSLRPMIPTPVAARMVLFQPRPQQRGRDRASGGPRGKPRQYHGHENGGGGLRRERPP